MEKQKRIISPTGCVHAEYTDGYRISGKRTLCNHNDYSRSYGEGLYHNWPYTDKPVTCKRCLHKLGKFSNIKKMWVSFTENCPHMGSLSGLLEDTCLYPEKADAKPPWLKGPDLCEIMRCPRMEE